MKKSQGISLISLVVTIVVLIILIGISIYSALGENIDEAGNTMDYNEIFEVSEAVAQRILFNKLNSQTYKLIGKSGDYTINAEIRSGDEILEIEKKYYLKDGWHKITPETSKELNLDKVRREYLVNYETGEVVSTSPIYYEGVAYFSAKELEDAIGGAESVVSSSRYDEEKGVNKPYVVEGMIPVKLRGNDWIITNVDDDEWYDYASTLNESDGTYGNLWANVMLKDEITVDGMTNEQVRSATLSQLESRRVESIGSMYVWIPRYSRGEIDGETKIVYSKLTEDYFSDATDGKNVIRAFEDNGIQLTGIWVSKYDAGYVD